MERNQKNNSDSKQVAEHAYHPSDYDSTLEVEQGLAVTHEQVSDVYIEGTINGRIERENGKSEQIRQEGYDE